MSRFRKRKQDKATSSYSTESNEKEQKQLMVSKSVEENISAVKSFLNDSFDLRVRRFRVGGTDIEAAAVFIDTLVKEESLLDYVIKPLMSDSILLLDKSNEKIDIESIKDTLISSSQIEEYKDFDSIILAVISGDTFLIVEGCSSGLVMSTKAAIGRSPEEPKSEPAVKGPRVGFVEALKDNIGLIRKRIKDPNLTLEQLKIGRRSKSDVVVVYIKGIVNQEIVKEVRKRLDAIDTDDGVGSAQIAHLISDRPNSIFPLVQTTERPDKVVAGILEGRAAIIMDGAPDAIIVPVTLPMLLQSVDDYYEKWIIGSAIRLGRLSALFISLLLPSLYVAIASFHPGILPTNLLLSIAGTRGGVPFPAFIEAFLMTATLEILIEAGIRLPKSVGQTVSIVGGLVIGQSAVSAGIVSPVMIIVLSLTAIASFAVPDYSLGLAIRILRVPFLIASTFLGAVGTSLTLLTLLGYTASLQSFGVGFLEPMTPYRLRDWKDTHIRGPQKVFGKRPEFLSPEDTQRQIIRKGGGSYDKK